MKTYNYEEVLAKTIEQFKGDELASRVWINKYCLKDSDGNLYESCPDDMHKLRIAPELARIESKYPNPISETEIYNLIKDFKYIIPQGSPMSGIGNNLQVSSLSNCFVIGDEDENDSYGGIFMSDQEQVQLMKRRGGVGQDLSHIRPKGSRVNNSALTSTGVVPFMERFSNSTREVAQDGRRGALMLSIDCKHPDSSSFISAKMEEGKVTGANISVKLHDDFMESVQNGGMYKQQYPISSSNPKLVKEINPKDMWKKIIHNAWKSAEPGILFWDTIIKESVPDCYSDLGYKTVSTNPCGEIPLCPYDSCRLFSINLYSYVVNPFTQTSYFDYVLFKEHVRIAQRLMDDLIDLEVEKIDKILEKIKSDPESKEVKEVEYNLWLKIKEKTTKARRTGLGVTAEGDMIAALGLRYGSDESIELSVNVHKTMAISSYKSSCELAEERGSFDVYDYNREINNPFINRLKSDCPELDGMLKKGRRNIACLTIAPAGTTSLMSQTTSGIEPTFLVVYTRRRKVNPNDVNVQKDRLIYDPTTNEYSEEYVVFHHHFKTYLKVKGFSDNEINNLTIKEALALVNDSPYYRSTSNDVDWVQKVKLQGAVQKYVDHSISVTVNLPNNATEEIVEKVYMTAWLSGCKGITIYRDGSRQGVLVSAEEKQTKKIDCISDNEAPKRPKRLKCVVRRFKNNKESWISFIGLYQDRPYEIFTGLSEKINLPEKINEGEIVKVVDSEGKHYNFVYKNSKNEEINIEGLDEIFNPVYWNYAKLVSTMFRFGIPLTTVVKMIDSMSWDSDSITTWKNGIIRVIKQFIKDGTHTGEQCSNCGSQLVFEGGCSICKNCGESKCG